MFYFILRIYGQRRKITIVLYVISIADSPTFKNAYAMGRKVVINILGRHFWIQSQLMTNTDIDEIDWNALAVNY